MTNYEQVYDSQSQQQVQNKFIVSKFQKLMQSCIQAHLYDAAVFYGDKLLSVGGLTTESLYDFIQALYFSQQYRRALHIIHREKLVDRDLKFKYLAGRCLYNCKEWDECLYLLGDDETQYSHQYNNNQEMDFAQPTEPEAYENQAQQVNQYSCIAYLKGLVYDTLENKNRAKVCYQMALQYDPYNYEAFQHLIDNQMMTTEEEDYLIQKLSFNESDKWLKLFYLSKCKKYLTSSSLIKIVAELEGYDDVKDYQPVINHESLYIPLQPYNKLDSKDEINGSLTKSSQIDERDSFGDMEQDMQGFSFDFQNNNNNNNNNQSSNQRIKSDGPQNIGRASATHQNFIEELEKPQTSISKQNYEFTKQSQLARQLQQQQLQQQTTLQQQQYLQQQLQYQDFNIQKDSNDDSFTIPVGFQQGLNSHPIKSGSLKNQEDEAQQNGGVILRNNIYVRLRLADWYIQMGNYQTAYKITSSIIDNDPYFLDSFILHFVSAVELGKKNDLFLIAHRLVDEHADKAVSWYAVGCYYTTIRQWPNARRYFGKATSLQSTFAPAWIALGNSFAAEDESDQAMVAYRTAARLFPGLATPMLGISLEYLRMSNLELAEQMLLHAKEVLGPDPSLYNQLGVLAFQRKDYQDAAGYFCVAKQRAQDMGPMQEGIQPAFEPIIVNFAQSLRKLKHYDMSIQQYELALSLNPNVPATHSSIALCYHIIGRLENAVSHYHFALSIRPDDPLTTDLLHKALQEQSQLFIKQLQIEEDESRMNLIQ